MSKEIRPQITQITQIGKNSNKEEGQDQLRMVLRNLRHLWTALGSDIRPQITQIAQIAKNSNEKEGRISFGRSAKSASSVDNPRLRYSSADYADNADRKETAIKFSKIDKLLFELR